MYPKLWVHKKKTIENSNFFYTIHPVITLENGNTLYIGNLGAAENEDLLAKKSIKAVLSVLEGSLVPNNLHTLGITHKSIDIEDYEDVDISKYFDSALEFINLNIKHTNVLVHCLAGRSRSATIILAYLIKERKEDLSSAEKLFGHHRISPNSGFREQLNKLHAKLSRL
jgi:protein-tyrosine phosphatase